jgi:hypothetical protein
MIKHGKVLIGICVIFICVVLGGNAIVMAQDTETPTEGSAAYINIDGKIHWLFPDEEMKKMTEEEYKKNYQLSPEEEAAIIHDVPPCPVIIDGVKYESEQIHLFDGQRLRFTVDNENMLYAFTTEEGIDKFHQTQLRLLSKETDSDISIKSAGYSFFYEDAFYGGTFLAVPPGYPEGYIPDLGIMNDEISSFRLDSGIYKACLYEDINYGGDVFERVGGTNISWLWIFGWNDKASSLIVIE